MNKRLWIAAGSALGLVLLLWLFLKHGERPNFSDFRVYWVAGGKAAKHLTVYDVQGHYQFKYSPFIALLWALPTHFRSDYLWSRAHYIATSIGWFALLFWLAKRVDRARRWQLWAAGVAVFAVALRDELKLGQVNLWPFLLVLPAWFAGRKAPDDRWDMRGFWIGAAWGFAVQWKLYALVFGPLWLLRRRPAVFVGAIAVTLLTLVGALALAHGWSFAIAENLRWVDSLTASSQTLLVSTYNVSVLGVLGKLAQQLGVPFGAWAYIVWLALLAAGMAALVWSEQTARDSSDALPWFWSASFTWALVAVVNPLVWPYWQLLVLPLFLQYFARGTERSWRGDSPLFWIVVGIFAIMNWAQNYDIVHYGGGLFAVLVLIADAYRQARSREPTRVDHDDVAAPFSPSSTNA
ncbi:MAG TPA: glycosyltransferase family 87 protein [Polyangiales bacterium]|nr:glycosyltransferase family 87 protein [Polyangiales bacterium]